MRLWKQGKRPLLLNNVAFTFKWNTWKALNWNNIESADLVYWIVSLTFPLVLPSSWTSQTLSFSQLSVLPYGPIHFFFAYGTVPYAKKKWITKLNVSIMKQPGMERPSGKQVFKLCSSLGICDEYATNALLLGIYLFLTFFGRDLWFVLENNQS